MRRAAALLLAALAACSTAPDVAPRTAPVVDDETTATPRRSPRPPKDETCGTVPTGRPPAGFEVTLTLDGSRFEPWQPVRMTLAVRNGGERYRHIVDDPPAADFLVVRDGRVVWRRVWRRYPDEPKTITETFDVGQVRTASASWHQATCRIDGDGRPEATPYEKGPAASGTYEAYGVWRGKWTSEPVAFDVTS